MSHLVITGAGRGLGASLAKVAASRGWRVSACARRPEDADRLTREAGAVSAVLDVRDARAVAVWLAAGVRRFGPVTLAISNAAILGPRVPVSDCPPDSVAEVIGINVTGAFQFAVAVLPLMQRPGGVLMQVSSYVGRVALPNYGPYAVSKFAIEGLARQIAVENAVDVISVALDPGMVATDMLAAAVGGPIPEGARSADAAAHAILDRYARISASDNGTTISLD